MMEGEPVRLLQDLVLDVDRDEQFLPAVTPREQPAGGGVGGVGALPGACDVLGAAIQPPAPDQAACSETCALVVGSEEPPADSRFDDLHAAIAAAADRTCRHAEVVAQSLRDDIRAAAEGTLSLQKRLSALETRHARDATALDGRVMALERQRRTRLR